VDKNTGRTDVVVILKNLEETARLCQRRKLNGYFLIFDLHHDNHNAIFYMEQERKIVINYDPNYMQKRKNFSEGLFLTTYRSNLGDL
jgi:hypothetical protein